MKAETWLHFIAWDNKGHFNASQSEILDWFKERLSECQSTNEAIIVKQDELLGVKDDLLNLYEEGIKLIEIPSSMYNRANKLEQELQNLKNK